MEAFTAVPALLKILILFAAIMVLYRLKAPLYVALLVISLGAGLWFQAGLVPALRVMARSAIAPETLFLCAVVVLILGFSNILDKTGILKGIVNSFSILFGRSMVSGAALPALIGVRGKRRPDPGTKSGGQLLVPAHLGILVAAVSRHHPGVVPVQCLCMETGGPAPAAHGRGRGRWIFFHPQALFSRRCAAGPSGQRTHRTSGKRAAPKRSHSCNHRSDFRRRAPSGRIGR